MVFAIHWNELTICIHLSSPSAAPSHLLPHPTPPCCHRALTLGACVIHQTTSVALCFTYGNVYASKLFCQIITNFPPPTESKSVCSFCLCLLCCPAGRVVGTIFLDSIYMS